MSIRCIRGLLARRVVLLALIAATTTKLFAHNHCILHGIIDRSAAGAAPSPLLALGGSRPYDTTSKGRINRLDEIFEGNIDGSVYSGPYDFGSVPNDGASPGAFLMTAEQTFHNMIAHDGNLPRGAAFGYVGRWCGASLLHRVREGICAGRASCVRVDESDA